MLIVAGLVRLYFKPPAGARFQQISSKLHRGVAYVSQVGLQSKLKVLVSFFQVVDVLPSAYNLELPQSYKDMLDAVSVPPARVYTRRLGPIRDCDVRGILTLTRHHAHMHARHNAVNHRSMNQRRQADQSSERLHANTTMRIRMPMRRPN